MSGFHSLENFSALANLAIGVLTLLGITGLGASFRRILKLELPSPWNIAFAYVAGILLLALIVEVEGILHLATSKVLTATWAAISAFAIPEIYLAARNRVPSQWFRNRISPATGVAVVAILLEIATAAQPSTKADELYYHMLLPARLVSDEALIFYRWPLLSAIYPQMTFQLAMTPLHALGFPHAGNLISVGGQAVLALFVFHSVARHSSVSTGQLMAVSCLIGLHPIVFHVTSGPHVFGELSTAAALVGVTELPRLIATTGPGRVAFTVGLFTVSAATSKLSMFPVATFLALVGLIGLRLNAKVHLVRLAALIALPWLVFLGPIVHWSFSASGSPLGPVFAGSFSTSPYDPVTVQDTFAMIRRTGQTEYAWWTLGLAPLHYAPIIWLGMAVVFTEGRKLRSMSAPIIALIALIIQIIVILSSLPYQARFLGGIQYGALIIAARARADDLRRYFEQATRRHLVVGVLLFPWLALEGYYVRQFVPFWLGMRPWTAFHEQYLPFYRDFVELDRRLPVDAGLLVNGTRLNGFYSPRPIYFTGDDAPESAKLYLFRVREASSCEDAPPRSRLIYENPAAVERISRIPGVASGRSQLCVFEVKDLPKLPVDCVGKGSRLCD